MSAEEVWRRRSDEQLLEAARRLEEYTDEGRRVIETELLRRGLIKRDQGMHVYVVNIPGEGMRDIVSVLPATIVFAQGLVPQAIVGKLLKSTAEGGTIVQANFARNKEFVDFLHEIIARNGPDLPGLTAEGKRLGNGRVYVLDGRTPTPQGNVPSHDIIGSFRVEAGVVVRDSYERNPNHVILSDDGFPVLDPMVHRQLMAELTARAAADGTKPA